MKSYDMENALAVWAPSPQTPHPGLLLSEEDVTARKVEAPTVSAVLGGFELYDSLYARLRSSVPAMRSDTDAVRGDLASPYFEPAAPKNLGEFN